MQSFYFCPDCQNLEDSFWCDECLKTTVLAAGRRDRLIGRLVHDFKYHSVRALKHPLAEVLDNALPYFDEPVTIVPLPTIRRHVRERGFDHTLKIAQALAKRRGWQVEQLFERAKNTVQVGTDKETRKRQARRAYSLAKPVDDEKLYLLLDDVWTTGASMKAAEKILLQAGVSKIVKAVLAVSV